MSATRGLVVMLVVLGLAYGFAWRHNPAEMHTHEARAVWTAAHEYNRGIIPPALLPLALNGTISMPVALAYAGWLRLFTPSTAAVWSSAVLTGILLAAAWYALLCRTGHRLEAVPVVLLLLFGTPTFFLLLQQTDSRHLEHAVLLPLSLLLFLRAEARDDWRPWAVLILGCLLGVIIMRGFLVQCLCLLLLLAGRRRWGSVALLTVTVAGGGALYYALLPAEADSVPVIAALLSWRDLPARAAALPGELLHSWGLPLPLAASFAVMAGFGAALSLRRGMAGGGKIRLERALLLYCLVYCAGYLLLGFRPAGDADYAPLWWRYRYLLPLYPPLAVLAGTTLVRKVSGGSLAVLLLAASGFASFAMTTHGLTQSPTGGRWHNYQTLGEVVGRRIGAGDAESWRRLLAEAEQRPALLTGLATAAVSEEFSPVRFRRLFRVAADAGERRHFVYSAGYWWNEQRQGGQLPLLLACLSAAEQEEFWRGFAAYRGRLDWWPEYNRARYGLIIDDGMGG